MVRGLVQVVQGVSAASEASIFDHRLKHLTNAHLFRRGGLLTAVFPILYSVVLRVSSLPFAEVVDCGCLKGMVEKCRYQEEGFCFAPACTAHKLSTAVGSVVAVESVPR